MKTGFFWMISLSLALAIVACGGGNDDDAGDPRVDDDDSSIVPGELTRGAAEEVMRGVVNQLQTQQNIEQFANIDAFVPQSVPQGKIGKAGEAIKLPGEVPCQELDATFSNEVVEILITFEGDCELPDGSVQSGSLRVRVEGDENAGSIFVEFDDYSKDGVDSDGSVSMDFSNSGGNQSLSITFDNLVSEGGEMDGSLSATIAADESFGRFEFDNLTANGERLDGYFEMTTDNATTVHIVMDLTADANDGEVSGQYDYRATDRGDGTAEIVGNGSFFDEALGQQVTVDFEMTIAPGECGDIPKEGHMTVSNGEDTLSGTFDCDDYIIQ